MLVSEIRHKQVSETLLDFQHNLSDKFIKAVNMCMFSDVTYNDENADCILVLGSRKGVVRRIPKAISLFKARRAEFILATGGAMTETGKTEAEGYYEALVLAGINTDNIILENFSSNTPENMMFSKKALEEKFGLQPMKLIVVTNHFHMKRAIMTAKQYFPSSYSFIPCPVPDSSGDENSWHLSETGRKRIEKELRSLVISVTNGWAADEYINVQSEDFLINITV